MNNRRRQQTLGSPQRRQEDLVWAAGFIDGEGCLDLSRGGARVAVSNTHRPSLLRLQTLFGGSVVSTNETRPRRRPCFKWSVHGANARQTLEVLLPWLVEKAPQARLVLTVTPGVTGRMVSPTERALRERVRAALARWKKAISIE